MRAPTNIHSTTRWDYQPDICKDYKETGFCGFGDSCKFLHDRTDYKFGWQLEQEELNHQSDESDDDKYEIHSSDEDEINVPHFCSYCRETFKEPVITKCMHYFCASCALKMYKKLKGRCQACDKDTEGNFRNADYILAKIQIIEDKRNKAAEESD